MPEADVDTEAEFRSKLTPEQYEVLRKAGTERPFTRRVRVLQGRRHVPLRRCGAELFSSDTKFDSGTGWPSFTEPATADAVELHEDTQPRHGAHRGHVRALRRPPRPRLP